MEQIVHRGRLVVTHPAESLLWEAPGMLKWAAAWSHQVLYCKISDNEPGETINVKAVVTDDVNIHRQTFNERGVGDPLARAVLVNMQGETGGAKQVYAGDLQDYLRAEPATEPHLEEHGAQSIRFDPRVPPAIQSTLRRLHQNLGHLGNGELARHVKLSGASSEAIKACKTLRCRTCQACSRPSSARPAKPSRSLISTRSWASTLSI